MKTLSRLLSQPLVQFLVIGALVFGLYRLVGNSPGEGEKQVIEVGSGRIAQLREIFSRTWQRPPTEPELRGLIESYIKEEVYYREGRKAGLDRDDTVIRRRMQQKMEFLIEPDIAELTPKEDELRTFFEANAERFAIPARVAFEQIFFNIGNRGETAHEEAAELRARLNGDDSALDTAELGDPTLLPRQVPLTSIERISGQFGEEFAAVLAAAPAGQWNGPMQTGYGLHLIRIKRKTPAVLPALDKVRDEVVRAWQDEKRRQIAEDRYRMLREKYEVRIASPESNSPTGREAATGQ